MSLEWGGLTFKAGSELFRVSQRLSIAPEPGLCASFRHLFCSDHAYHRVRVHPFFFAPASEQPQDVCYQRFALGRHIPVCRTPDI